MARARGIKPGFFTNDLLAEVDPLGRLLFAGLWTVADREGRLLDRPRKIKAEVLPYDDCDPEALLAQLAARGFIERYTVNGVALIQVVNWKKHQQPHVNERDSELPPPVAAPEQHPTSTVQAPEPHRTNPSDSGYRIPDSRKLTPDTGHRGGVRAPAGVAPPKPRATPKKAERNLGPLVDAFREVGLADPKFTGAEAKAAADLLALWPAADLAACWQDHASGEYGDDFSRRELSFGYLSVRNRVGNWAAWRQEQAPVEAPVHRNGLTHMPREPGVYAQGVRCQCGHCYSIMAQDCPRCHLAQLALRRVTA